MSFINTIQEWAALELLNHLRTNDNPQIGDKVWVRVCGNEAEAVIVKHPPILYDIEYPYTCIIREWWVDDIKTWEQYPNATLKSMEGNLYAIKYQVDDPRPGMEYRYRYEFVLNTEK